MCLSCVKVYFQLYIHTRRDDTDKVHNSISHLNSNYAIYLKDPVHISKILFRNRLLLATIACGNRQPYLVQAISGGSFKSVFAQFFKLCVLIEVFIEKL